MILYNESRLIDTKTQIMFVFVYTDEQGLSRDLSNSEIKQSPYQKLIITKLESMMYDVTLDVPKYRKLSLINQKRKEFFETIAYKLSEDNIINYDELINEIFDDTKSEKGD